MPKQKLFDDDSEEDVAIKTENEYAKKYDAWREKEERHKLEQKYGTNADQDASLSTDSEDDTDEPPEVSEEMETQFLKTLALLKTKDPRIYNPEFKFFDEKENSAEKKKEEKSKTLTFEDSDDDDDDPNIFTIEKKAEIDEEPEPKKSRKSGKAPKEGKLKDFLTGKAEHLEDEVEKDLEPLKAFWSDPKLNEGEAFLRDYILNKRYLEEGEVGEAADQVRDDEDLEADERLVEEQGKFERAYNFRFEEPDDEYLKRYPRTMNYIRPKDDARARKRAEVRTRKEEEKKRKMEEIARLRALKLKEIQEKIARLKEVTGNQELAFKDEDIEGEFDPEEHDRRMRAIFDEQYYGEADHEKPVFPDMDEELEIENWENYEKEECDQPTAGDGQDGPHCEDEDFNMDADYDPKQARTNLLEELKRTMGKKRRNRKRKTKLGELLSVEKPKFVPHVEKSYGEFMEEYYKMDCEDVIGGDLPTRFKYREVVPNDYGLSVEEILLADDKELTQWVPLKKIVRLRPENEQRSEVGTYAQRAADVRLKRKVLPSLFKDLPEEPEVVVPVEEGNKKKKKKKNRKDSNETNATIKDTEQDAATDTATATADVTETLKKKKKKHKENGEKAEVNKEEDKVEEKVKKKKKKRKQSDENDVVVEQENEVEDKVKRKKEKHNIPTNDDTETVTNNPVELKQTNDVNNGAESTNEGPGTQEKKKSKKNKQGSFIVENIGNVGPSQNSNGTNNPKNSRKRANSESQKESSQNTAPPAKKKKKKQKNNGDTQQNTNKKNLKHKFKQDKFKNKEKNNASVNNPLGGLSDERLKAYGLNPKKYRGFLKYKKF